MTTLLWTLVVGAFLPYVWVFVAGSQRARLDGGFDNNNPRAQAARLEGLGARANAAQQNAWEALALYTPCVLISHLVTPGASGAATVGLVWVAARIVHGVLYCLDQATLRSLVWMVGLGCSIALVVMAA